jgi:hypothetical protein
MTTCLSETILAFKSRKGSNDSQADHLLHDLRRDFDGNPHTHNEFLQTRADYIASCVNDHFGTPHTIFTPLDNGKESLVIDCNNGHILKLRSGAQFRQSFVPSDILLAPSLQACHSKLKISFEVFPKAEMHPFSKTDTQKMVLKCLRRGYFFYDSVPQNMGMIKKDGQDHPIIIDSGAVFNLTHPIPYIRVFKKMASPLYKSMPFIHPLWHTLKNTTKEILYQNIYNTPKQMADKQPRF